MFLSGIKYTPNIVKPSSPQTETLYRTTLPSDLSSTWSLNLTVPVSYTCACIEMSAHLCTG